jgi:hypothetical protein
VLFGFEHINPGRARDTALYAEGLMDEIGAIFTIIASRLIFVSHVLEELEEGDEAEGISTLIDADRIDALLDEFHYFLTDYRAGSTMDIHLALKAGQIVQKLDRMVVQENLGLVLDPDYLRRVRRLISDYTTVHRGFRPPRALQPVPVAPLVCGFIDRLKHGGPTDDDLIGTADDPAAFSRALVRRIARVTVFDSVSCNLSELPLLRARTDPVLLTDVIRTILEDIAGTGTEAITVSVTGDSTKISVTITCEDKIRVPVASDLRKRFLAGECLRAGGTIAWSTDFVPSVRIDLPVFVDAI